MKCARLAAGVALLLAVAGCGGDDPPCLVPAGHAPPFLDVAMTQEEIDALKPGDPAYARVERPDGVHMEPIALGEQYDDGNNHYILFEDPQLRFGTGDSGSPILDRNGRTIGALSGSLGGDSVTITLITNMVAAMGPEPGRKSGFRDGLAWYAIGLSADQRRRLREAGIPVSDLEVEPFLSSGSKSAASPSGVSAGSSMAIVMFEGPLASIYMAGTATHAIREHELVAFGHSIWWWGALRYPLAVKPARVLQFVRSTAEPCNKVAVPAGEIEGGITQDRYYGILFDRRAVPERVEIVVHAWGRTTTHWIGFLDYLEQVAAAFMTGLDSIVHKMADSSLPGVLATTVTITWRDDTTATVALGDVDWAGGASAVWDAIDATHAFYNMKRLDVNLEPATIPPGCRGEPG